VSRARTCHDPCRLTKSMNVSREPRGIRRSIPGVIVKEMSQPDAGCGSGGSCKLAHSETSASIAARQAAGSASADAVGR